MTDLDPQQRERRRGAELTELGDFAMRSLRDGAVHTIALSGELDLANADVVERELERVERGDAVTIMLDLSGLTFMDSNGVRLVLGAHTRSQADAHRLALRRGPAPVQRVFELSGVVDLLPFVE